MRRSRLVPLLAVLAPLAAAQPAAAWMPRPVEFQRAVPLPAAHSAGGPFTTAPLRTGRRFDMVGVQWAGRGGVRIALRARSHTGHWSRWTEAASAIDGPDPGEGRRSPTRSGEPIWAGGSDRVQLRLSRPVARLRLRLLNTTGTATARDRASTAAKVVRAGSPGTLPLPATQAGEPPIIPRAAWGASRCKPRTTPGLGNVQLAFVHHTVSLNSYSRAQAASVVLGVCLFHRNGRGWNDMGYNFLVDRYGRIFEGRAGGIDEPIVGAQAGGFNVPSTGVSVIGDFSRSAPPAAAMSALSRLLAWKLSIHGVPATGHVTVTSAGGSSTGYRAGTRVTLNRISGHRDADQTSCPGAGLYAALPALRRRVAALEGQVSGLTIATSTPTVAAGTGPIVSGTLTLPGGQPGAGEQIELRALAGGREQVVGAATAAADGTWSATLPAQARSEALRAVFAGDGGARPGVFSPPVFISVVPAISLTAEQQSVPAGGRMAVDGTVSPAKPRVTLTVYRVLSNGRLKRESSRRVPARSGSFHAAVKLAHAATYRLLATVPADAATAAGRSAPVEVQAGVP